MTLSKKTESLKTIFHNISWLTLQDMILQPLGLVFFIILGRMLGDTGLGLYSYLFTIGTFFSYILDFGLTTYFWRKWSSQPEGFATDLPKLLGFRVILLLPFTFLFGLYVFLVEATQLIPFILVYLLFVLDNIKSIPLYYAQATNQFKKVVAINLLDRGLVFILGALLLLMGYELVTILIVYLVFRIVSTVYAFYLFHGPLRIQVSISNLITVLKPSLILLTIQVLSMVFFKVDTVMIRFMLGIDAVGLYSASYKLVETILLVPNMVLLALFPSLMKMNNTNEAHSTALVQEIIYYLLMFGIVLAALNQLHADEFISLIYGQSFSLSILPMEWLGWAIPFLFANTVMIAKMLTHHKDRELLYRSLLLILINVILNYLLIPQLFITGAAIATVVSEIINFFLLLKMTKLKLPIAKIFKVVLIAAVVILLGFLLPFHFVIELLLELVVFFALLVFFKLFSVQRVIELVL